VCKAPITDAGVLKEVLLDKREGNM